MKNAVLDQFISRLDQRFSRDSLEMKTSDWVTANTFHKGRPFTFDDYPFQKQIIDDLHPDLNCIKPSQVGMTEVQIRKIISMLIRNRGTKAIYTMPNLVMMRRISQTRVSPIIAETPLLNNERNSEAIRSMGILQMDESFLYVTATNEGDATSIDADFLFNDEIDITDQKMLALFSSRLQNSNHKIHQKFSTPTFPGRGVDAGYENSDKHEYFLKCHACNHWQVPMFNRMSCDIPGLPDDVEFLTDLEQDHINKMDLMEARVVCENPKCRVPLDLKNAENRQWVAEFPERKHARGYRIRPFSTDRIPIHYILGRMMEAKRLNNIRSFHNTVLGESYASSSNRMSEAQINRCFEGTTSAPAQTDRGVWVGVDMGLTCHYVVVDGNSPDDSRVIEFGTCAPEDLKAKIIDKYPKIHGGIVDRLPYTPTAKQLQRDSNGKIVPIQYGGQVSVTWKKDENYATGNRTLALDEVLRQVQRGMKFYGYGPHRATIITHLMDMVRDDNEEEGWANWEKISGQDHFFHALGYALLSFKLADVIRNMSDDQPKIMAFGEVQELDKFYNIKSNLGLRHPGKAKHSLTFR